MSDGGAFAVAAHGRIEPAVLDRDLDGILSVDAASFSSPWTRQMFTWEACNSDVARLYIYRTDRQGVIAYCAVWHVFDELHVNNLAVLPAWRRQGVASELLTFALARAAEAGVTRATLEVRASNLAALRLYEQFGFRPAGVRKSYYTNPVEDAHVLWCDLQGCVP